MYGRPVSDAETTAQLRACSTGWRGCAGRLEQAESSEEAVDLLQDLAEIAKETQAEIERARGGPAPVGRRRASA